MKVALISKIVCPSSIKILEYFVKKGYTIEFVIVEQNVRSKFSKGEIKFRKSHDEFNKTFKKYSSSRRAVKWFWERFIPSKLKKAIFLNSSSIPIIKNNSIEHRARRLGIDVHKVKKHSSEDSRKLLKDNNIELVLFGSSNWLLKKDILDIENCKIVNVHPGKLPEYKGLDSMPWSILDGAELGSTAFFIDETIDGGDILGFYPVELQKDDNIVSIQKRMSSKKPTILYEVVKGLSDNSIVPIKQPIQQSICKPMSYDELILSEEKLQRLLMEKFA